MLEPRTLSSLVALLVFAVVPSCSDPAPSTARAYIDASLSLGSDPIDCRQRTGAFVLIGSPTSTIASGDSYGGVPISVDCIVHPSGDGFDVTAGATASGGSHSGSMTIKGHFTATGKQQNIQASFNSTSISLEQADCTVDYTQGGMTVASGRVWGMLTCPKVADKSKKELCAGVAEFKFENCGQ